MEPTQVASAQRASAWMQGFARFSRTVPTLMRVGFAQTLAYRSEFVIWILSTNMPIIMMMLWIAVSRDAPIGRMGAIEFKAYFLSTLVVRLITGSWVAWELSYEIREGLLPLRLLRPIHPLLTFAADNIAAVPFRLFVVLPVIIGTPLWIGIHAFANDLVVLMVLFPVAMIGAWLITFASMAIIGTLCFYWESALSVFRIWLGLFFIFSGYTIPLELFPKWLQTLADMLPFRFQLSYPVELLVGLLSRPQALLGLLVQWSYALMLLALTLMLWRRGLKRYAAFGG